MRPVELVLERLSGVEKHNGFYRAFCPAHDDYKTPNLDVGEGDDGWALVICRAGCAQEQVLIALEEKGLSRTDLFTTDVRRNDHRKKSSSTLQKSTATVQPCTLEAYARAKRLPVEFLEGLGLADRTYQGRSAIRISYLDTSGKEASVRFRTALEKGSEGDNRFRWRTGSKAIPYGLWRLEDIRKIGYVVLVEGESDTHTLWHHRLPALGVPGASNWRQEWADHLEGTERVYAVIEPDEGGEAFKDKLTACTGLRDHLYLVELDGDVSALHVADPEGFQDRFAAALKNATPWAELVRAEAEAAARVAWSECEDLAREPDILIRFARDFACLGVAGESRLGKLVYLAVTSRLLPKPVSIAVKGPSSGGKSYTVEQVLRFFPEAAYYALTAMSEHALAYSDEPLSHRFLVIYEAAGMNSDLQTYLIRSLLSEGQLRYETVEKTSEGMKPRLIEREGPTGLLVTTTAPSLHRENETRLLSLTVTDTREQTASVMAALAEETTREGPDLDGWRALQGWLEAGERRVTIPYAAELASLIPPIAVRLRRDFGALLNLIRAHALLHRASRKRDRDGLIVATVEDYARVRELVADLVSEGVEAAVPPTVRETVEKLTQLHAKESEPVTVVALAAKLELDRSAAWRRARAATDRGYIKNLEDRKGRPAQLVPGDPLPDDVQVLPSPETLRDCTVAGASEGVENKNKMKRAENEDTAEYADEIAAACLGYLGCSLRGSA